MQVKIFDYEHEADLEKAVNNFLKEKVKVHEIKYATSHFACNGEQIFSFSCMILFDK